MIEESIRALLLSSASITAIVGDRVYPLERPQGSAFPAIVYHRITGAPAYAYDGPAGLVEARFQIDAWSDRENGVSGYAEAKTLARAIKAVVSGYKGTVSGTDIRGIFIAGENDLRGDAAGGTKRLSRVAIDIITHYRE